MSYRESEAYQRSCRVDPTTGESVWPLPPMGKRREEMEAAMKSGKVTRIRKGAGR